MQIINTSVGPKSPSEALFLFKFGRLPAGSLFGIYTQLLEHAPEEGAQATEFVGKNPDRFSDRVKRIAKEESTGRPTGAKRITSAAQALGILKSAGPRPTLTITFRADRPDRVRAITALCPTLISFLNISDVGKLICCVYASRQWQSITRSYTVTVNAVSESELEEVARGFEATIESIELKHNMKERVAVWMGAAENNVLVKHPDIFYDTGVFRATCDAFNRRSEADGWIKAISNPNASMRDVISALPHMFRLAFLEQYIICFNATMTSA